MAEQIIAFPELDQAVSNFMTKERLEGRNPEIVHDEISGKTFPFRTVCIVSGNFLTEFQQFYIASTKKYESVKEKWIHLWHAELLINHVNKTEEEFGKVTQLDCTAKIQ